MGGGYVLYCTVCKINYSDQKHWNRHLLATGHQDRAKYELALWDEEVRKCAIVLYSSFPLVNFAAEKVIQYFSEGKNGITFITDFVLSASNPKIAVLQFESSTKLREIFSECGGPLIKIDEQLVQLRKLWKLLEVEWSLLHESFQSRPNIAVVSPPVQYLSTERPTQVAKDRYPANQNESNGNENENTKEICNQFRSVLQEVEIPDEEFNSILKVIQEIKELLEKTLSKTCVVVLYRTNFLKLRNTVKGRGYFIHAYSLFGTDQISKGLICDSSTKETMLIEEYLFKSSLKTKKGASLSIIHGPEGSQWYKNAGFCWSETRRLFFHQQLGIDFQITHGYEIISELQLSRLVSYYCEFDTRVRPLLALTFCWANLNYILLTESKTASLEWLLLFFLYHSERIIPAPKYFLDQTNLRSVQKENADFELDFKFVNSWRTQTKINNIPCEDSIEFILSVLELFQAFFSFCGEKLPELSVLYTRNGEILTMNCINNIEDKSIRGILKAESVCKTRPRLVITHPINSGVRLPLDKDKWLKIILPAMKKTSSKLLRLIGVIKQCMSISSPQRFQQPFPGSLKSALRAI